MSEQTLNTFIEAVERESDGAYISLLRAEMRCLITELFKKEVMEFAKAILESAPRETHNHHYTITLDTPYCTLAEYERRTGIKAECAKKEIYQGRIVTMPKQGRERVRVNLAKEFTKALAQQY